MIKPRQPVPSLNLPLVSGGTWSLDEQKPEAFTLVVFYRGYHCPICRDYIIQLNGLLEDFKALGVTSVVAVSGDDIGRVQNAVADWGLDKLQMGYSQSIESMREWGLFISKAIKEGEPNEFGEPGLFIIKPDGTLYAVVQTSMPFLRPDLNEVLNTIRWVVENDYPARGEQ